MPGMPPAMQRAIEMIRNEAPHYCLSCRSSLHIARGNRCPGCGLPFDPNDPATFLLRSTPGRCCKKCLYDLHGLSANRCPECGTEFDPLATTSSLYKRPSGCDMPREFFGRLLLWAAIVLMVVGGIAFFVLAYVDTP